VIALLIVVRSADVNCSDPTRIILMLIPGIEDLLAVTYLRCHKSCAAIATQVCQIPPD
jgi:hypothetical protein